MIRRRLTPTVTDYQRPRDNKDWPDSVFRLNVTAGVIAFVAPKSVADMGCGDGSVLAAAHRLSPIEMAIMADISVPTMDRLDVPFPHIALRLDARLAITQVPRVDMVVMTEILEHVEDPDALLRSAATKAKFLVASSPNLEPQGYTNPEHVWEWDTAAFSAMLADAGWGPMALALLDLPFVRTDLNHVPTQTQVWLARAR